MAPVRGRSVCSSECSSVAVARLSVWSKILSESVRSRSVDNHAICLNAQSE